MEKIGIICEYNPFHNGHLYHINAIKKRYPDSIIILALSGYFTERGEISILSKYDKTRLALRYGVNLVLEIPMLYSTNSADIFGRVGVNILNEAGVDRIIFGSESNDIEKLKDIASKFDNEDMQAKVRSYLKEGTNYPTSLAKALDINLQSNDILAISYIKAINKINPKINPETIKRTNSFNDLNSDDSIISAQNIRNRLELGLNIQKYIPVYNNIKINKPDYKVYFDMLRYKILTDKHLDRYLGVDEGLDHKLKNEILKSNSLDELIDNVKSKRYTISRLRRMLTHILVGIERDDIHVKNEQYRILGFDNIGREYLKDLCNFNLIFKYSSRVREIEILSSILYDKIMGTETAKEEILNKPVIKRS